MSETPSVPGWYITFQTDVLSQLPRPGQIDYETASGWHGNREALNGTLHAALCPPSAARTTPRTDGLPKVGTLLEPINHAWVQLPDRARWADFAENPSAYCNLRLTGGLLIPDGKIWREGVRQVRVQVSRVVRDCDPLDLVYELGGKSNAEFYWRALFGLLATSHPSKLLNSDHGAAYAFFLRVDANLEFAGLQHQGDDWVLGSSPLGYVGGGYVGSGTIVLSCTGTK